MKVYPYITQGILIPSQKNKIIKKRKSGSSIAKSGFKAENDLKKEINDMGTDHPFVRDFKASKVECIKPQNKRRKADLIVMLDVNCNRIAINYSLKKTEANFSQAGRIELSKFEKVVGQIPFDIKEIFERFLAFKLINGKRTVFKSINKKYETFSDEDCKKILTWIKDNKDKILNLAICGNDLDKDKDYMVIIDKNETHMIKILDILKYCDGEVGIKRGAISIGDIFTIQRKGGDGGKKTANDIQFKIKPKSILEKYKLNKNDPSIEII